MTDKSNEKSGILSPVNRRKFITGTGIGLAALWASKALGTLEEFEVIDVDPLRTYPYRNWEDLYRRQFTWDKWSADSLGQLHGFLF
jgi:hypothetical protein